MYKIQLTESEVDACEFASGRYLWPTILLQEVTETGLVVFTEAQMWAWCDDAACDSEGGHSLFPLASPEFAGKLSNFYHEAV